MNVNIDNDNSDEAIADSGDGSDLVLICHVPEGGDPITLELPQVAVDAHLANHPNDYLGACIVEITPEPDIISEPIIEPEPTPEPVVEPEVVPETPEPEPIVEPDVSEEPGPTPEPEVVEEPVVEPTPDPEL